MDKIILTKKKKPRIITEESDDAKQRTGYKDSEDPDEDYNSDKQSERSKTKSSRSSSSSSSSTNSDKSKKVETPKAPEKKIKKKKVALETIFNDSDCSSCTEGGGEEDKQKENNDGYEESDDYGEEGEGGEDEMEEMGDEEGGEDEQEEMEDDLEDGFDKEAAVDFSRKLDGDEDGEDEGEGEGEQGENQQDQKKDPDKELLNEKFFNIKSKLGEIDYEDMIIYSSQSYEIIKNHRDLIEVYFGQDFSRKKGVLQELQHLGKMIDTTKSLIYGLNEVTVLLPDQYDKVLKKREQFRENPFIKGTDAYPIVESYVVKEFQSRYNAFLLFILNNSQDELLMTFTEFSRRVFPAGLPMGSKSALPQNYTDSEIRDLKNFLKLRDNMTEEQYRLVVEKNLMRDEIWKNSNEKDNDGNQIRTIEYTDVLPYIILGFYCYVTGEVEKSLGKIANATAGQVGTSLSDCFKRAGLSQQQWNSRVISYSMAENALLFYKDKNTLNIDQIELVLRMLKEKINVHNLNRQESKLQYYDHILPRKSLGRWLMSELALLKQMKELAQNQYHNQDNTRDQFRRKLFYEEKMTQIAINKDKLDYAIFTKLVTKNLLILLHARKKFNVFLDLNNHSSIDEALEAQFGIESSKAYNLLMDEFKSISDRFVQKKKEALMKQADTGENSNYVSREERAYMDEAILDCKKEFQKKLQAKNVSKLFKETMWNTYEHTSFPEESEKRVKMRDVKRDHIKLKNHEHYTVQEFNEALYFAMREFSTYVNFSQVENATYSFFMDRILANKQNEKKEQNKEAEQEKKDQELIKQGLDPAKQKDEVREFILYPVMHQMLDRYSTIFINNAGDTEYLKTELFEDNRDPFLKQPILRILRRRDRNKLLGKKHMGDPLQSEVEAFRSMKLVDVEFTRYGYQIMIEEAHRQTMQTMILMYLCTFRTRSTSNPDELIKSMRKDHDTHTLNLAESYLKLQRNYLLDKKQLTAIRNQFKEEQTKRAKIAKQRKDEKNNKSDREAILTDSFYPMNHTGYKRFKTWKTEKEEFQNTSVYLPSPEQQLQKVALENFYDPSKKIKVKEAPTKLKDMVNIMLSINYLSGFSKYKQEDKQKGGDVEEVTEESESSEEDQGLLIDKNKVQSLDLEKKRSSVSKPRISQIDTVTSRMTSTGRNISRKEQNRLQFKFNSNVFETKPIAGLLEEEDEDDYSAIKKKKGKKGGKGKKDKKGKKKGAKQSKESDGLIGVGFGAFEGQNNMNDYLSQKTTISQGGKFKSKTSLADKIKLGQQKEAIDPDDIEVGPLSKKGGSKRSAAGKETAAPTEEKKDCVIF